MKKVFYCLWFCVVCILGLFQPAYCDLTSKAYVGYVVAAKEDISNKVTNFEGANATDTKYPSALAVKTELGTKVDTGADAIQTMQGKYTVSGTLYVPTPPLP